MNQSATRRHRTRGEFHVPHRSRRNAPSKGAGNRGKINKKLAERFRKFRPACDRLRSQASRDFASVPKDARTVKERPEACHVAVTTPYILTQATTADWTAYLKRSMLGATDAKKALHRFLKYGKQPNHRFLDSVRLHATADELWN